MQVIRIKSRFHFIYFRNLFLTLNVIFLLRPILGEIGLFLLFVVMLAMFWLNPWSMREASHHPAFMRNWPSII